MLVAPCSARVVLDRSPSPSVLLAASPRSSLLLLSPRASRAPSPSSLPTSASAASQVITSDPPVVRNVSAPSWIKADCGFGTFVGEPLPTAQSEVVTPLRRRNVTPELASRCTAAHSPGPRLQASASIERRVATCPLCGALLRVLLGRPRYDELTDASALPAPPPDLVERAVSLSLWECDELATQKSLCDFCSGHERWLSAWGQFQCTMQRGSTLKDEQSLVQMERLADDMSQLAAHIKGCEAAYIDELEKYVARLQQEWRRDRWEYEIGKLNNLIGDSHAELTEMEELSRQKISERQAGVAEAVKTCQSNAKHEFWKKQDRKAKQEFSLCFDEYRRINGCTIGSYSKKVAAHIRDKSPLLKAKADRHIASCVEREQLKQSQSMDILESRLQRSWEIDRREALQRSQSTLSKVDVALRWWEERHRIEHRAISRCFSQYVARARRVLERVKGPRLVFQQSSHGLVVEPFICGVLRREFSAFSAGNTAGLTPDLEVLAGVDCGHRQPVHPQVGTISTGLSYGSNPPTPIAASWASAMAHSRVKSAPSLTFEVSAFAQFIGVRFPTLHAAFTSMDLSRSGSVACFALQDWLCSNAHLSDHRILFKDLDRSGCGKLCFDDLRPLAAEFHHEALRGGRPAGSVGATLASGLFWATRRGQRGQPAGLAAAFRCAATILEFLRADGPRATVPDTRWQAALSESGSRICWSRSLSPARRASPRRSGSTKTRGAPPPSVTAGLAQLAAARPDSLTPRRMGSRRSPGSPTLSSRPKWS